MREKRRKWGERLFEYQDASIFLNFNNALSFFRKRIVFQPKKEAPFCWVVINALIQIMQHFHARTTRKKLKFKIYWEIFRLFEKVFFSKKISIKFQTKKFHSFILFGNFSFTASKFPNFRLNKTWKNTRKRSDHEKKIKYETKLDRIYVSMFVTYSVLPYFTARPLVGVPEKRNFFSEFHKIRIRMKWKSR